MLVERAKPAEPETLYGVTQAPLNPLRPSHRPRQGVRISGETNDLQEEADAER
jgi:hypothetical protein